MLWCWRRLLRVLWTARRSKQSILKEISLNIHCKDWCLSWNSNILATWCKELTHLKRSWCWEIEGRKRRGWQRMRWLDDSMRMSLYKLQELVINRKAWNAGIESQRVGLDWMTKLNWREKLKIQLILLCNASSIRILDKEVWRTSRLVNTWRCTWEGSMTR